LVGQVKKRKHLQSAAAGLDMKNIMVTPLHPYGRGNLANALRKAARAILDEAGPEFVCLRETARRVGVSAPAAYRHFANKEELLASVAAEGFRELAGAIEGVVAESQPLGNISLAYLYFALRKRALFQLMFGPILAERAKYPELNEVASAVFGLLKCVVDSADMRSCGEDAAVADRPAASDRSEPITRLEYLH
jgi:AcrR family transcriptional regulator